MDLKKLLKIGVALIIVVLFSVKLAAQDTINTITFTWNTDGGNITIGGTANEEFTIDWGDGTVETRTPDIYESIVHMYATHGKYTVTIAGSTVNCRFTDFRFSVIFDFQVSSLTLTGCSDLQTLYCYNGILTELDLSGCPNLTHVGCSYNQINSLDLSGCPNLKYLICFMNQLTHLDLSGCLNLLGIDCWNNQLQLSDLFAAHLLIDNKDEKWFGTQNLQPQTAILGEELFSGQSVFNGIFTNYSVIQNDNPASESNYTVIDGKLIFNTVGKYTVTMTNDAIISKNNSARVVVEITVEKGTGIAETERASLLQVYPNPTTGELRIETGELRIKNVELFDMYGKKILTPQFSTLNLLDISHLPAGMYFVRITTGKDVVTKKVVKI